MCGISGIVQTEDRRLNVQLLHAMTNVQAHRGPDGEGYVLLDPRGIEKPFALTSLRDFLPPAQRFVKGYQVGLGHRRLAVVDLTPLGHQPMGTEDGRFWITYNGEVYNAPELRQELIALGHRFRSSSDTEVVLESFRRWGPGCLPWLNGMFAFAVWDSSERILFCVRDRFGIKPFYYRQDEGRFVFASEIKALLQDPEFRRRPHEVAIADYLTRGRHDHTTATFFQDIGQLAPGECLTVRVGARGGACTVSRSHWYRLPDGTMPYAENEAAGKLRDLLEDSVRLQMRADVSIGSCLSGGLDSSSIVCLMHRLKGPHSDPLHAFTLSSEHPQYDERPFSRAVVQQTASMAEEIIPDPAELFRRLPDILWQHDEPISGPSVLGQWTVMRAAGQAGIKVLLDGQGADELLLGYPGFVGSRLADLVQRGRWPTAVRELSAWRRVHGGLQPTAVAELVRGVLPGFLAEALRTGLSGQRKWLATAFVRACAERPPTRGNVSSQRHSVLAGHMARSLTEDLPALLHYEDRNAMAFSVESRVPFLDHRLVEWLIRLPPELKIRDGMTKAVLRDAMVGVLPDAVRLRPDKMGFVTPDDVWLRTTWRREIEALCSSESFHSRPYWQPRPMRRLYEDYCEGRISIAQPVWRWICLETWLRRFCD